MPSGGGTSGPPGGPGVPPSPTSGPAATTSTANEKLRGRVTGPRSSLCSCAEFRPLRFAQCDNLTLPAYPLSNHQPCVIRHSLDPPLDRTSVGLTQERRVRQ